MCLAALTESRRYRPVFKLSNSFVDLRSLTLSDVPLVDEDIAHLSDLFLESLFLDDTQLGDEA